jgi:hypothetical protein
MNQGAGIGVFQHPQRAIGALFHIADAFSHCESWPVLPALGDDRFDFSDAPEAEQPAILNQQPIANQHGHETQSTPDRKRTSRNVDMPTLTLAADAGRFFEPSVIGDDVVTRLDALVADEHCRTSDQLSDTVLILATKRALLDRLGGVHGAGGLLLADHAFVFIQKVLFIKLRTAVLQKPNAGR